MRKNKNQNKIYLAIIALLIIVGCDDILNRVEPPLAISGEVALSSPDAVRAIRASMYSKIRASMGHTTDYFIAPSSFTDELRLRPGASRYQGLNQANSDDGGRTGLTAYTDAYSILKDVNLMIGAVADGVLPAAEYNRYKGEALVIRAFTHFHLVRTLGYDPTSPYITNWNVGVILRTTPTLDVADADFRARSTVQEVYAQVIADLQEAISLLSGTTDRNYISEPFAEGLLSRVYLYQGNWAAANTAAANAMAKSGRTLANTATDVANMFDENSGNHSEGIFTLVVHPSTEQIAGSNVNNGPAVYTTTQWGAQLPPNFVLDLYEEGDYRLGWYKPCFNMASNQPFTGCTSVNRDGVAVYKFGGDKGNNSDDLPYFRLAELYLIRAEAAAKAANNPAAGVEFLNQLRAARGVGPVPASALTSMTSFEDEVLNERVRELIAEGHRFYDLKRLGRTITHPDGTPKFRPDSHRILSPIAEAVIALNPLVVQNPGYN